MKRKKSSGGGANWQDTYGDMVTLLLCFFVLLYSAAEVSETKWAVIVQSLKRNSAEVYAGVNGAGGSDPSVGDTHIAMEGDEGGGPSQEDISKALEQIYQSLQDYSQSNNLQNQMTVMQGSDYVFITFRNAVFFQGDSFVLLDAGKVMLDQVASAIQPQSKMIDEIRVMGHTSQGDINRPNNATTDRFLASNRASTVLVYLQEKNVIDAGKLVSVGYGQWRPIAPFDTEENKAKNRRVELMITGLNVDSTTNAIKQYYVDRGSEPPTTSNE